MPRTEEDSLGEVTLPDDAYYGAFTKRAMDNFSISRQRVPQELITNIARIKKAAARTNNDLRLLDDTKADVIQEAADEVIEGLFADAFPLDVLQAGAGTPMHMNVNEVIANRATELLGDGLGSYTVDPNDDVNMGQSTNNVVPTALRLTVMSKLERLGDAIGALEESFEAKAEAHDELVKVGRTHLQDAVPVTVGQELSSYARTCAIARERMEQCMEELSRVGLGGNAVGTGINTPEGFREAVVDELASVTGRDLEPVDDAIQETQSMSVFADVSGRVRSFLTDMIKMSDDLMLLGSGPRAGIGEYDLPEVEPGSSIMPGKVNPSIVEAFKMTCIDVLGMDRSVGRAATDGDLQMNVMAPVIAKNLCNGLDELTRAVEMLDERCIQELDIDEERVGELMDGSTAIATALSPYLGYKRTAELVHAFLDAQEDSFESFVADRGWLTEEELDVVLDPERMTEPHGIDTELRERVQERLDTDG